MQNNNTTSSELFTTATIMPEIPTPYSPLIVPSHEIEAVVGVIADVQFAPRPNQFNYAKTHERCYHRALSILKASNELFNQVNQPQATDLLPVNPGVMYREESVSEPIYSNITSHHGICLRTYDTPSEGEYLKRIFNQNQQQQTAFAVSTTTPSTI
eukprot:UN03777